MESELSARLAALPRLATRHAQSATITCKVCGKPARFFDVVDFWKGSSFYPFGPSGIPVSYYRCSICGFIFAPMFDNWSRDDFRSNIYNDEYLLVDGEYLDARPKRVAHEMVKFLAGFEDARLLDYGSGTGSFAAHMRRDGFDQITSFDPFSQPDRPSGLFDIITCFEVIEHSPTPLETLRDIASLLSDDGCVILGEALQPSNIESIRCSWWYCMPRNGHISFYTDQTLALLASRSGLVFHPGEGLHALSRPVDGTFADLARRISAPLFPATLGAPGPTDSSPETKKHWHNVEYFSGVPTRWSAEAEVSWNIAIPPAKSVLIRIRLPFANEVRPGFATESKFLVDGMDAKTSISDHSIVAEVSGEGRSNIRVTLQTPAVVSPSTLRSSSDDRRLGLAIPCFDGSDVGALPDGGPYDPDPKLLRGDRLATDRSRASGDQHPV
jgi:SAM-dependent methyltransferase